MTKKEKLALSLKIKAVLDLKKGIEKVPPSIAEKQAQNNRRRQMLQKAKSRKGDAGTGSKHKAPKKQDWDFEKW